MMRNLAMGLVNAKGMVLSSENAAVRFVLWWWVGEIEIGYRHTN